MDAEPVYQPSLTMAIQPLDNPKRTHSEMLSGETVPTKNFPIFGELLYYCECFGVHFFLYRI